MTPIHHRYADRWHAGRLLAESLSSRDDDLDASSVVLALPRGGVPVGAEVAQAIGAELDVLIVRKLGVPGQPELGFGAVAEEDEPLISDDIVRRADVTPAEIDEIVSRERAEIVRRARRYRGDRPMADLTGRTVLVVDDGIATGGTAAAAVRSVRRRGARRVVLAAPVGARDSVERLRSLCEDVVVPLQPELFVAVGQWYDDFRPTLDEDVVRILAGER